MYTNKRYSDTHFVMQIYYSGSKFSGHSSATACKSDSKTLSRLTYLNINFARYIYRWWQAVALGFLFHHYANF